ncbi:MAG: tRNA (adenosine(37)-N6)-dimethylallyltransferase MiaA [Lachnospiraceae bacterium]
MQKRPLIVLTGPTAVGKTKLSITLAKEIGGEILSADSMQVYRYMDIGSAKITPKEMEGVKHYLIDVLNPWDEFNVVVFQKMCKEAMEEIWQNGHIPILTGGTGFYIQAVLYDIDFTENDEDDSYRKKLEETALEKGNLYLHDMLKEVDAKAADEIHPNNVKRVIRALEFAGKTGDRISEHNAVMRKKESPYNFSYFVLNDVREKLYDRINQRVDEMMENGLVREVKKLHEMGCNKEMVSMQGLGYKEILEYLDGETTLEEAVYKIKRDTRHFAKRQLTWFRREKEVTWINKEDFGYDEHRILEAMLSEIKEKKIIG